MTAEIRFFWARLNANYWFYPATFAIFGALLAFAMIYLDRNGFAEWLNDVSWLVPARPKGASDILTVMASTMIGVGSTVFSITIVAVSYASGTYGPRLLTNFLEDKGNQIALATFIGSFVYALIVLRSVRGEGESPASASDAAADALPGFAPQLSLLVGYVLLGLCVAVLVFFLHHAPSSIRINMVLKSIGSRLVNAIENAYPEKGGPDLPREAQGGVTIDAWDSGYIQMIDFSDLVSKAREKDCVISMRVRTGDFVHPGMPLMDVRGCEIDDIRATVREDVTIGPVRTPEQDPRFLIDELVEIGLRALSPGINDPFTAITAMHWLGAAMADLGQRDLDPGCCEDDEPGLCPVIARSEDFAQYVDRGFGALRSAVATSANAAPIMLDVLENAALPIPHTCRRQLLREQGRLLMQEAEAHLTDAAMDTLRERYKRFGRAFYGTD
ncbi:DUF2254 domain-containing protein [Qipengyuania nanhaisediminis]|uniref:DUF2254 domain-containing protein n=1 Tax=Qipengyuania nanhaisediminis TaxID=604088 RepID=UPI0038B3A1EF